MPQRHNFIKKTLQISYSSKNDIKSLQKIKVLFIHSQKDSVVPFKHYQKVKQNCKAQNQSLIYEGEHIMCPIVETQKYIEAVNKLVE